MKKFIYSCLFLAMAAMTFSSCEDVPAPYNMPTENSAFRYWYCCRPIQCGRSSKVH